MFIPRPPAPRKDLVGRISIGSPASSPFGDSTATFPSLRKDARLRAPDVRLPKRSAAHPPGHPTIRGPWCARPRLRGFSVLERRQCQQDFPGRNLLRHLDVTGREIEQDRDHDCHCEKAEGRTVGDIGRRLADLGEPADDETGRALHRRDAEENRNVLQGQSAPDEMIGEHGAGVGVIEHDVCAGQRERDEQPGRRPLSDPRPVRRSRLPGPRIAPGRLS